MYSAYKLNKLGDNIQSRCTPFPIWNQSVRCSMSGFNCCFLFCIQASQETGNVAWYSYLFKNIPQFVVIHTVKGFSVVNEAEVDVFWNFFAFSMIQRMLATWSLAPLPFLNPVCTYGSSWFTYCWNLAWRTLSIFLLMWNECNYMIIWTFFGIAFLWDRNENWPFPVLWPLLSFPSLLEYWVQHFSSSIF